MSERCGNCGAGLFAGQQFCRLCGAAVRAAEDETPTRILGQGPAAPGPPTATVRLDPRGTEPSIGPRPTDYQPPLAAYQQTAPLQAPAAPRGAGRAGWLIALVVVAAVSVLGTLALVYVFRSKGPTTVVVRRPGHPEPGVVPPLPPELPARVREAVAAAGVPLPLDEAEAEVSDDETVVTHSFPLEGINAFSLKNISGPVEIEGWDGDEAEVKVTKRGGSREMRRRMPVLSTRGGERLALQSGGGGHGTPVTFAYEVKLPRRLRQVEISSEASDVRVEGLEGTVVVDVRAGELEFRDVTGTVRSNVIKGNTKVVYERAGRNPQEFKTNLGDVEVEFPEAPDASLKAETLDGKIEADEGLGLTVRKAPAGYHAVGRIGEGRAPLLIRVVNGDIRLKH